MTNEQLEERWQDNIKRAKLKPPPPDDQLECLEKAWRASLPILSLKELVDMYPGSEKAATRGLQTRMKQVNEDISSLNTFRDVWHDTVINKASFRDQPKYIAWLNERVEEYLKEYNGEMAKYRRQLASLNETPETYHPDAITDAMVATAKAVPIDTLVKVNRAHKALCVWHEDKNPSMHYYKRGNRAKCFACGARGDAIDVYCAVYGVTFKEAVKAMV